MQIFIMPRSYHGLRRRAEFAPRARARPPGRSPSTDNAPARSRDDANATSPSGTRPRIRPDRLQDATLRADETAVIAGDLPRLAGFRGWSWGCTGRRCDGSGEVGGSAELPPAAE